MFYNAETYRWEGNENALNAFDNAPASTPSTVSVPQHMVREKEVATPRPALITNISATKGDGRATDIKDDWLVGEEFDVGPEFVRRQREEEDRWRKKCEKWVGRGLRDREVWRWTIRDLVSQFDELTM